MSFETKKVVAFSREGTYRGPSAVVELDFPFVFLTVPGFGAIDQLDAIVRAGLFAASITKLIKDNYLGYELAVDTKPFFADKYRVTVFVAGETEEQSGKIGPFLNRQPAAWTSSRPLARVSARHGRGTPQAAIAPVLLVAIAVAIGILLVFAAISYKVFNGSWGAAALGWGFLLPIGLVLGGVYLVTTGALTKRQAASGRREVKGVSHAR